jgi:hypothetical protein
MEKLIGTLILFRTTTVLNTLACPATCKTKQKKFDAPRTCDSLKSTASPLSLRDDDACDPAAPPAPPPMPRRFFDTPSTCEHGAPQPDNSRISVSAAPSTEAHPALARGRQAKLAPTRNAPHRSAGARAALAAAGAARGRRRRGGGGGGTSRRPRRWRGRGGAPGRRGARQRTPFAAARDARGLIWAVSLPSGGSGELLILCSLSVGERASRAARVLFDPITPTQTGKQNRARRLFLGCISNSVS